MRKIFLVVSLLSVTAFGGFGTRGGGMEVEREFVKIAGFAAAFIDYSIKRGSNHFDGFSLTLFEKAINDVEIYGLQKICEQNMGSTIGGQIAPERCTDAHYLPEKNHIEFDINIWNMKTCMQKMSIVTHEYGRASGNEGGNYKYSSKIDQIDDLSTFCNGYDRQLNKRKR